MILVNTCLLITASVLGFLVVELDSSRIFINNEGFIKEAVTPSKSKHEAAIAAILKEASLSVENGAYLRAVDAIKEGLQAAINLVASSSDTIDKALASATAKSYNNPEAAIKDIQKGMKTAQQLIFAAGFPIYYSFNVVKGISGDGANADGIRLGLRFAEQAGTYAIACLSAAEVLATHGLKLNVAAAAKGLDAAQEVAKTGYDAAFSSLVLAGRSAFKGLSGSDVGGLGETQISKRKSEEALAAESAIMLNAERAVKYFNQGPVVNAVVKIKESLIYGIEAVAAGEATVLKAITITTNLALTEPEIAIAAFEAGIKSVKMGIITAGNRTCHGLGEAANMLENQKNTKLISAILKLKTGINSALVGIETASKLASTGLSIGGDVAEQGLKAAYKSISVVLFVLYSLFVTISQEAL